MARNSTPAHHPSPKSEAMVAAEAALVRAQTMPWGPERLKALHEAGVLRNAAIELEMKAGLAKLEKNLEVGHDHSSKSGSNADIARLGRLAGAKTRRVERGPLQEEQSKHVRQTDP